jgi:flavin-dependent dehydrogenase
VYYDVVVAGGSVAGLLCAREIASSGNSILVIEEDYEIGTPEHCGGLVSTKGLKELGIIPFSKTLDHLIDFQLIQKNKKLPKLVVGNLINRLPIKLRKMEQ